MIKSYWYHVQPKSENGVFPPPFKVVADEVEYLLGLYPVFKLNGEVVCYPRTLPSAWWRGYAAQE